MLHRIFTAFSLLITIPLLAQEYGFHCFMLEDGLPRAHVTTVQEDHDGFLLIGTRNGGLARFDGQNFLVLDENQGLNDNDVSCSAIDTIHADRPIWIGSGRKVDRFQNGNIHATPHTFPSRLSALAVDTSGALWVGTVAHGVYVMEQGKNPRVPGTLPFKHVVRILAGDEIVVATEQGAYSYNGSGWTPLELSGRETPVRDMIRHEGRLIIATHRSLFEEDTAGVFHKRTLGSFGGQVQCVFMDSQDRLWIGTSDGAIKVESDGTTVRFSERSGLSDDDIRCIYQDKSGAIWLGTAFGGICKFTSEAFIHYSSRSGLGDNIVSGTLRDKKGELWISTYGGGVTHLGADGPERYTSLVGLPSNKVHAICAHQDNGVFAATDRGAAFLLDGKATPLDGFSAPCTSVIVDREGDVWLASASGWMELEPDNWKVKREIAANVGYVSDMDTLGRVLYASTDIGVFVIRDGVLKRIERKGMPEDIHTSIAVSSNGDIWTGTAESGLIRIMEDTIERYGKAEGLSADQIELVMMDAYENVWVGTKRGIDMLELDVLQEFVLDVDNYTTRDGFIGMEVFRNSGMLDSDGTLWFGTTMGATHYDPEKLLYDNSEPNTRIIDILLNYENIDWSPYSSGTDKMTGLPVGLSLPSKKNHLTFDFAGISLAYPDRVRYQYILDGYDPEWSPITSTSRITYSNIPPGEYSFKVISRNSSGIWNQEPVSFDFEIRAPLWQNRFFLVGLALFIALSVFGFIKFRENSFVKEQARLELMVDERTHELSRAKKRSEDLLLNILPVETARELRDHGKARAREYRECSVLFSDFKGFTSFSSKMNGEELVAELDSIFRTFDAITDKYDVEKIKTIGDAYMCASGLPEENRFHALNTVLMGLEMIHALDRMNQKRIAENRQVWQVRVGIHTGPLVAGVVGEKKFAYDIWGDTVNTASRMEHYSEPGRLNISGVTLSHVMDYVETSVRGPLYVKGKGELMMYFVERIRPEFSADEEGMVPNKRLMSMLRSESAYIGV